MKHNYPLYLMTFLLLCIGVSCTSESLLEESGKGRIAEIVATIGSAPSVETKAELRTDDGISYLNFEDGDAIGFFSNGGLVASNEQLTFDGSTFKGKDDGDNLLWQDGEAKNIFAYYPYPETPSGNTVSIWRAENTGSWKAGFDDFLTSYQGSLSNGSLIGLTFEHRFAMLIIKRGIGFDNETDDVRVTLNQALNGKAEVTNDANDAKRVLLLPGEGSGNNFKELQSVKSTAGSPYMYYYIIPLGNVKDGSALSVESITIKNNVGDEMTLPFTIPLVKNTKYTVTVEMRNNQAVIEPEEIRRWEDENVTVEDIKGISDWEELKKMMAAYNSNDKTELAKYGTEISLNKWEFLLLQDITMEYGGIGNQDWNLTHIIGIFKEGDVFDGQGHTIKNLHLKGDNAGFFSSLAGKVKNLKLENIQVDGGSNSGNFGGIAAETASTGEIINCHILGNASFVIGAGNNIGGLVGLNGGVIQNSTSSAMITGAATNVGLLVGSSTGTVKNSYSTGSIIK